MTHDNSSHNIHNPHDLGYKSLLSHGQVCMDFLRSFLSASWVAEIDSESLMEVSGEFVLSDYHSKRADLIFQFKLRGYDIPIYLLIELQSTVDSCMPYRLSSYSHQLLEQLLKRGRVLFVAKNHHCLPSFRECSTMANLSGLFR